MNLIAWILFGAIAGWIAHIIKPSTMLGGLLGTIVLGIVGGVVGGFLGNLLFGVGVSGFNLSSFFIAVVGSLIVLVIAEYVAART